MFFFESAFFRNAYQLKSVCKYFLYHKTTGTVSYTGEAFGTKSKKCSIWGDLGWQTPLLSETPTRLRRLSNRWKRKCASDFICRLCQDPPEFSAQAAAGGRGGGAGAGRRLRGVTKGLSILPELCSHRSWVLQAKNGGHGQRDPGLHVNF